MLPVHRQLRLISLSEGLGADFTLLLTCHPATGAAATKQDIVLDATVVFAKGHFKGRRRHSGRRGAVFQSGTWWF